MAVCVQSAVVYAYASTSGGSLNAYSVLTPLDPQPASLADCGQLLISGGEYVNSFSSNSPFVLDPSQAAQIGGAILLLWAVAWVIRVVARMIFSSSNNSEE